ncbi:MAG: transposase [Cyanobacteria bacterium WB6_1B_304]|nr:transposase [Cyanobacteria bacterium WB6_1B_304]
MRRRLQAIQRKRHTPEFKTKVALEVLKGNKTINEIASEMGIHATQITQRKWSTAVHT